MVTKTRSKAPQAATPQVDAPEQNADQIRQQVEAESNTSDAPALDLNSLLRDGIATENEELPSIAPPSEVLASDEFVGITAWHNSKKITALWNNSSNRNAFVAIAGLGWKKISNANDSSFLSMVMMAAHAENANATVNLNIGSDDEIHAIYVW